MRWRHAAAGLNSSNGHHGDVDEPTGRRVVPHNADVTIEAWAPTRTACYAEAVRALVDVFADRSGVVVTDTVTLRIGPGTPEDMLAALLDEVIYLRDVMGMVPADVDIEDAEDGGLGGTFDLTPLSDAKLIGPPPKAVSRSDLHVTFDRELWTCRATIDV